MTIDDYSLPDSVPEPPPDSRHAPLPDDRRRVMPVGIANDIGLPANIDAEKTILGAILLDNQAFNEAAERLEPEDFSLDSHRRIFLRMADLMDANQAVDIVTLANELARMKEVESIGGVAYLASLTEGLPRRPVIDNYIRIVKDKSALRRIMGICSLAIARAAEQSESALEVLEAAESSLLEIAQGANVGKLKTIFESVKEAGGMDAYIQKYTDPDIKPGLLTGFHEYDLKTGGLQKSELTIIAARPGAGKSALMLNIAENVGIGTDNVVAIFSLEMSRPQLECRMMASKAWVNVHKAMEGIYLGREEKVKLQTALGHLVETNIYIDDSATLTPVQLRAKCRRLKQRAKRLDLVLIDYLTLMSAGSRTGSREQEIALISRSLKQCAKELEVPVVALAQLNRNPEARQDKRPMLSDLRESGQIEQDADVVVFVHRPSMYDPDNPDLQGLAELILAKQRSGPTGVIKLAFVSQHTRFDNLARS